MWVSDSGRDRVFAYTLAGGARLPERDLELAERNRDARGIWSNEETMWVLDGGKDALFAYDLATGDPTAEYALDSTNGDPHGLFFDGVTFWVSDHGAKRLFAYRLETGEDGEAELGRNRDEEFPNTILSRASNNSPRGIWSDGDVMYVADESDDKVYTYNMPDAHRRAPRLAHAQRCGLRGVRTGRDGVRGHCGRGRHGDDRGGGGDASAARMSPSTRRMPTRTPQATRWRCRVWRRSPSR